MVVISDIIDHIIEKEGGYVDDPSDSGGETNFGITKQVASQYENIYNTFLWNGDMRYMPEAFARFVYEDLYVKKPNYFELLDVVDSEVFKEIVDCGVNCGTKRPIIFLQRILNSLNNCQKLYTDLAVDGVLGRKTLAACEALLKIRGKDKTNTLLFNALNALQAEYYISLVERRERDERFLYGWLINRVAFKKSDAN